MTEAEDRIVAHYGKGGLFERIMAALAGEGVAAGALTHQALKPVDEFHIGGLQATEALLDQLRIDGSTRVLDIGAGVGGTARHIAARYGAPVAGVDLTPEFVDTARRLTDLVGLKADFRVGSAFDLPFDAGGFDLATLIHVGMNLSDKTALFREAARVLRAGGVFAVYDIMRLDGPHPKFPAPWASSHEDSFLAAPEDYLAAAAAAGFELRSRRDRGDFARAFFARMAATLAEAPRPPLGLGVIMGPDARQKVANMAEAVAAGGIAPVEMIFVKPAEDAPPAAHGDRRGGWTPAGIDIRAGGSGDAPAILDLYPRAFPDEDLAPLVAALLAEPEALSLVAADGREVLGHIVFSPCAVEGTAGRPWLLGPLAVAPGRQRQGLGSALIREGVRRMAAMGARQIQVLGDPAYYGRFGFEPDADLAPPYPIPEAWRSAWRRLRLDASPLSGVLAVMPPWRRPELWGP